MNAPRPVVGPVGRPLSYPPVAAQWTARKDVRPAVTPTVVPYTRRYEIRWIDDAPTASTASIGPGWTFSMIS